MLKRLLFAVLAFAICALCLSVACGPAEVGQDASVLDASMDRWAAPLAPVAVVPPPAPVWTGRKVGTDYPPFPPPGDAGLGLTSAGPGSQVYWGSPSPGGAAGGALTGTYPNPGLSSSAVNAAITSLDGGVLQPGTVAPGAMAPGTAGQVMQTNATPAATWVTPTGDVAFSASGGTTVGAISGSSPIAITPNNMQWVSTATAPELSQTGTGPAGGGAPSIEFAPQGANATNGTPGGVTMAFGSPTGTGTEAALQFTRGGTLQALMAPYPGAATQYYAMWGGLNGTAPLGSNSAFYFKPNVLVVNGTIFPSVDATYSSGIAGERWLTVYAENWSAGSAASASTSTFTAMTATGASNVGGGFEFVGGAGGSGANGGYGVYAVGGTGTHNGTPLEAGQNGNPPNFYVDPTGGVQAGIYVYPIAGNGSPVSGDVAVYTDGSNNTCFNSPSGRNLNLQIGQTTEQSYTTTSASWSPAAAFGSKNTQALGFARQVAVVTTTGVAPATLATVPIGSSSNVMVRIECAGRLTSSPYTPYTMAEVCSASNSAGTISAVLSSSLWTLGGSGPSLTCAATAADAGTPGMVISVTAAVSTSTDWQCDIRQQTN